MSIALQKLPLKPYYPTIQTIAKEDGIHLSSVLRIEKKGVWYEKLLEVSIPLKSKKEDHECQTGDWWVSFLDEEAYKTLFRQRCYVKMLVGQYLIDNGDEPAEDQRSEFRRLVEDGVCDEMGRIKGLQVFDEKNGL